MFRNISIAVRIISIMVIFMLSIFALTALVFFTANNVKKTGIADAEEVMMEGQRDKIKLGTQTMAVALGKALSGVSDRKMQHDIIYDYIKNYRFEEDSSGYYYTYIGTVIFMHPTLPQREGEDLGNTADVNGVFYVRELYENARKGGGFVSFTFPKPGPNGNMQDAPKLAYVEYIPGTDIWISTGIYVDNVDVYRADMDERLSTSLFSRMRLIIAALAVLVLLILLPLCIFILRSIIVPLRETVRTADEIAKGNLNAELNTTGTDEIAILQKAFKLVVQNMKETLDDAKKKEMEAVAQSQEAQKASEAILDLSGKVEQAANDVENTVNSVSRRSNDVKNGGEAQAGKINGVLASMEHLSAGVKHISDSALQAASQSQASNDKVESGVLMAKESGKAMGELNTLAGSLNDNIGQLGEQSEKISAVMGVISDIAAQIDLLAMNASIEAAHAGETGRGFAVVAGEVRKLAEKTRNAAGEVDDNVQTMNKLTKVNITSINTAVKAIEKVSELSGKTVDSLTEAQQTVREAMIQVQSIASAVEEQAASSDEVTSLVNEVSSIAKENAVHITAVTGDLESLLGKSTELLTLVSELRR